jgi:GNAT superfamily N-acetyltransferase
MPELLLRDAHPGDRDAIRDLTLAAYQEYATPMRAFWEGYRQNILATLADTGPAQQIVAEQEGALVGTVLLYPPRRVRLARDEAPLDVPCPEVRLLAVAPAARGRGIGSALMRECVRRARQSGHVALSLHTTELMLAAMRMYARLGFARAPELDFHPAPGVTVQGYRLELQPT